MVREKFGLDVLAEIPPRTPIPPTQDLFGTGWPPEVFEAYQRMAANFEILVPEPSTIAVVSWVAEEGKTTVTANLAWALAGQQRPVLAIDCDLRNPALDLALGVSDKPGVTEVAGSATPRSVRQSTPVAALHVIASGQGHGHPSALLSNALPDLLTDGRRGTETVLIDAPPMLAAEATYILSQVDAAIVVVDMKRRSPDELETMLEDLSMIQVRILGVVLNRAERLGSRSSRYYSTYVSSDDGKSRTASSRARSGARSRSS